MTSDLEIFLSVLANGPLLQADAVVVLCGEDIAPRLDTAEHLMKKGAAPLCLLSGGRDKAPRWSDAITSQSLLMGHGISPSRLLVEPNSLDTREQAVAIATMAAASEWSRVLLVASAYHMPRAFLTVLKALGEAKIADRVRLIPVSADAPWGEAPAGMVEPRVQLLEREYAKIDRYHNHVAHPSDGTNYLMDWERR